MFKWDGSLSVGVDIIDKQHQELFELLDGLTQDIKGDKAVSHIGNAIAFLEDYVRKHFYLEEKYMTVLGYPAYDSHILEHKSFIEDFEVMKSHYKAGEISILTSQLEGVIYHWLVNHVSRTDKAMAEFLRDKLDKYYE